MNDNYAIAGKALRIMFLGQVVAVIGMALAFIPVLSFIAGLATIVGAIMSLVGLIKAAPAHPNYGKALTMIVISVVASVLASVMAGAALANALLSGDAGGGSLVVLLVVLVLPVVLSVAGLLQVYFSCNATSTLVREKGNEDVAVKGDMVFKITAVCYGVNIVLAVVMFFSVAIAGFGAILTSLASIVSTVIYLIFLKESSEVLSA